MLAGVGLSLWRRMRDRGAHSVQSFAMDMFPLFLLFAISVTGLALTASQEWLRGEAYSFVAILHAITVIGALLFLPFHVRFFHIFQRPAQLGVKLYHEFGDSREPALCALVRPALQHALPSATSKTCGNQVLGVWGSTTCHSIAGPVRHWRGTLPFVLRPAVIAGRRTGPSAAGCSEKGSKPWLKPPAALQALTELYGPHPNYTPTGGVGRIQTQQSRQTSW